MVHFCAGKHSQISSTAAAEVVWMHQCVVTLVISASTALCVCVCVCVCVVGNGV